MNVEMCEMCRPDSHGPSTRFGIGAQNGSYLPKTPLLQTDGERSFIFIAPSKAHGRRYGIQSGNW